jgi:glycolate oxidase FAD binding subunit
LPVWRLSAPPASGAQVGEAMRRTGSSRIVHDWAGGLIWAEGGAPRDLPDGVHWTRLRGKGGSAFSPQTPGVTALSERVRAQFDPLGLFNPGRMGRRP